MEERLNEPVNYRVITYGCQMNEHDSELLCGLLESRGFCPVDKNEDADIIILNTCAVRQKAEDKVTGFLGEMSSWKKEIPGRLLAVGGCMTQQPEIASYIKRKFPVVDVVFGTHSLPDILKLIDDAYENRRTIVNIDNKHINREGLPLTRKKRYHAWVPIIYGCNNFCSYCVVPYVRGSERSRNREEIISEVIKLADEGCREIMLLGQNVNAYGKDLEKESQFPQLLQELDEIKGIERIRFLTSHPKDFEEKMIKVIASSQKICEHFHLPIQSGSDHILKNMNRGYSVADYRKLISQIKDYIPDAAVTSDIIVGFPGESDKDFGDTMDLLEEIRFDAAYTFVYSERKNTPAADIMEKVPPDIKKERITKLIEKQQEIGMEINKKLLGKSLEVMVEGKSKNDDKKFTGRTKTNKLVHFTGGELHEGDLCMIKITGTKTWHLSGEIIQPGDR